MNKIPDYVNGSNVLVEFSTTDADGNVFTATGHCTSNSVELNTETKERAVKPVASASASAALFKEKSVAAKSVTISGDGLVFDGDTEHGYAAFLAAYNAGRPVKVRCVCRGQETKPWLTGSFTLASLSLTAPAQDDSTYSYSLENNGEVILTPENFTMPLPDTATEL